LTANETSETVATTFDQLIVIFSAELIRTATGYCMRQLIMKIETLIIMLLISAAGLTQKTDKVYLKNGDVITGEVKSLKFAQLSFDMTGPGTIQIKWEEIVKIISDKTFQITTDKGLVIINSLDSFFFEHQHLALDNIVEIVQIKDKFLQRLDGDINLGFNYAKANHAVQFNFGSSITYRIPKVEVNLKLNSVISDNASDTTGSKKQDATLDLYRKLNRSYYLNGLLGWQENSELGLDNRFLISGVGGKILFNSNRRRLLTGAGLSYNLEQSEGNASFVSNLEGLIVMQFKEFHYSTPKLSIDTKLALYPGLSDWGRFRMDFQLNTKVEIFKDFNIGLSFYEVFDNRPPSETASKSDFGINFTLGYEFGK
jgi:hypothetical protein